jgi:hypothetical protein
MSIHHIRSIHAYIEKCHDYVYQTLYMHCNNARSTAFRELYNDITKNIKNTKNTKNIKKIKTLHETMFESIPSPNTAQIQARKTLEQRRKIKNDQNISWWQESINIDEFYQRCKRSFGKNKTYTQMSFMFDQIAFHLNHIVYIELIRLNETTCTVAQNNLYMYTNLAVVNINLVIDYLNYSKYIPLLKSIKKIFNF